MRYDRTFPPRRPRQADRRRGVRSAWAEMLCHWLALHRAAAVVPLLRAAPALVTSFWRPGGRVLVPSSRVLGEGRHYSGQPGISSGPLQVLRELLVLDRQRVV